MRREVGGDGGSFERCSVRGTKRPIGGIICLRRVGGKKLFEETGG